MAGELPSWGRWYGIGNQYRKEWSVIRTDVLADFPVSGFVIVFVPQRVWNAQFLQGEGLLVTSETAIMGVTIAVVSFVGRASRSRSLRGGGISVAGVIAFVDADPITIPVPDVSRKYDGRTVTLSVLAVL